MRMNEAPGSFRDPSGRVYVHEGRILRSIGESYSPHWERAVSSGLLKALTETGRLVSYMDIPALPDSWKSVEVEKIPFISYPYEWSFEQLRAAALLTLDIQKECLSRGMSLKDASAFNVQFQGARPLFIDLLSFECREPTAPWQAYRQFCMHFLAPLALYSRTPELSRLSSLWIDGIPLNCAWKLLPWRSALSPGLQIHLHLHAKAEKKHGDAQKAVEKVKKMTVSTQALIDLADSLTRTIEALPAPGSPGEWTEYYCDTNYSQKAEQAKADIVSTSAARAGGALGMDLGANTGKFSRILAEHFSYVIAADIDAQAVGKHYSNLIAGGAQNILPLVLDLSNPSPAIGWACSERFSWMQRTKADFICALALTHHLFFTYGIPWDRQAAFFAECLTPGGHLVVEFVPPDDSQVRRLLAARDDVFADYHLEGMRKAFSSHFTELSVNPLPESQRCLLEFKKSTP